MARGTLDEGRSRETRLLTPSIMSSPPRLLGPPPLPPISLGRQIRTSLMECLRESDIPRMAAPPLVVSLKCAIEMFKVISAKKGIESRLRDHNLRVELRRDGE